MKVALGFLFAVLFAGFASADQSVPEISTGFPTFRVLKVGTVALYCPNGTDVPVDVVRIRELRIGQGNTLGHAAGDKYAIVQPLRGGPTREASLGILIGDIGEHMSKVPAVGRLGRMLESERIVRVDQHFGYRYGSLITDLEDGSVHMVKTDFLRKFPLNRIPKPTPPTRRELFSGMMNLNQLKPYGLINVMPPLSEGERARLAAQIYDDEARRQAAE